MIRRRAMAVAALAPPVVAGLVGGMTFLATSALIGRAAPPQSADPVPWGEMRILAAGEMPGEAALATPVVTIREMGFVGAGMSASALGRDVLITGEAEASEHRGGHDYVWSVRVREDDRGGRIVRERHYTEGAIRPAAGEDIRPKFADAIELPAGRYYVELFFHAAPANFPWDRVGPGDDLHALGAGGLRQSRTITIE